MDSTRTLALSCPGCAARMPETAAFCPGCGQAMPAGNRQVVQVGGLPENVAGVLAYITFIPAIAFLVIEPYKRSRFVHFHSMQCLLLWATMIVISAVLRLVGTVVLFIPMAGPLLMIVVYVVAGLAAFLIWLILVVKAFRRETFKLPVLGDLAERYFNVP